MNSHLLLKNRLKQYRLLKGLTQSELANMVCVSQNTISSIECGCFCPTAFLAAVFCRFFDCKFEDLFYFDEESSHLLHLDSADLDAED